MRRAEADGAGGRRMGVRSAAATARLALSVAALSVAMLAGAGAAAAQDKEAERGYGAHLASYNGPIDARRGWRILQGRLPALLKGRKPIYREAVVNGRSYVRLLTGPFDSPAAAAEFCDRARRNWEYCNVLSLVDLQPVETGTRPAARPASAQPAPPKSAPPKSGPARQEPPLPLPVARPEAEPEPAPAPEATGAPDVASGSRLVFDSANLPPPPEGDERLTPQQAAIYRPLQGNWIQFDGDCRSDLLQLGEGAVRSILGGAVQPADRCEARREGATVALFCDGGKEYWFEVLTDDEIVFRRTRAHGGAPYQNIDQLMTRCEQG